MKQIEMSKYLKIITIGVGVLFFMFVGWLLPSIFQRIVLPEFGALGFWGTCIVIWVTAIPIFVCLFLFWGICIRIENDESFSRKNAKALKRMSQSLLVDCICYVVIFLTACIGEWYQPYGVILLFGIFMILVLCITMVILCAALSHLVYKASQMQEEQDLTI